MRAGVGEFASYSVGWILEDAKLRFDVDATKPGAAFTGATAGSVDYPLLTKLNEGYAEVINHAQNNCNSQLFRRIQNFTWPGSVNILDLRTYAPWLAWASIIQLDDVTGSTTGVPLYVENRTTSYDSIQVLDQYQIKWGLSGPGGDRTIRATYLANPEEFTELTQVPQLVPFAHRYLLVWKLVELMQLDLYESVPKDTTIRVMKLQDSFISALSHGRVRFPGQNVMQDIYDEFSY